MPKRTTLIALEGIPGSGKTTIMNRLRSELNNFSGVDQILPLDLPDEDITLNAILKSDQLKTKSFLNSSVTFTVLDRYYQSTLAYHWSSDKVYGEDIYPTIQAWKQRCIERGTLITPDYTFFIDVDPELSVRRKERQLVTNGDKPWIRKDFLEHMRDYYLNLSSSSSEQCILIDGQVTIEEIIRKILTTIKYSGQEKS